MAVHIAHTADLPVATLRTARELLEQVFGGDMTAEDWDHALGGVHALVWDGDELIGHGAVIQRQLMCGDRILRTGYVEGVAVRADRRCHGHGAALMRELEQIIRSSYDLGALAATDDGAPFYATLGWRRWEGATAVMTPSGIRRTPAEDGHVYVLEVATDLDVTSELVCDFRAGDPW